MTVSLDREHVGRALNDSRFVPSAVGCEGIEITRNGDASQIIEWSCPEHPGERGRLALIAAPADRGTELHLSMAGEKNEAKGILRRLKMLLETGEIATGALQ